MARPLLPLPRRSMLAVLPLLVAASPQPSAPPTDAPQAAVVFAPYRHDDLLWENDRTAHRIYCIHPTGTGAPCELTTRKHSPLLFAELRHCVGLNRLHST